jgi:hypothetical protein
VDRHGNELQRTLDHDLGDAGLGKPCLEILADLVVFNELRFEVLAAIPV